MATEEIRDRRRMFELFTQLKVTAVAASFRFIEPPLRAKNAQEQSLVSTKVLDVGSVMGGKDSSLAAVIDETIRLWTKMWISDAEHDTAIAENVQAMQRRCGGLLRQLVDELQDSKFRQVQPTAARRKLAAVSRCDSGQRSARFRIHFVLLRLFLIFEGIMKHHQCRVEKRQRASRNMFSSNRNMNFSLGSWLAWCRKQSLMPRRRKSVD